LSCLALQSRTIAEMVFKAAALRQVRSNIYKKA
jgi:hypothetical protein